MKQRDCHPKESKPAEIQDFDLIFFSANGVACAVQKAGATFHGVLHLCTDDEMAKLDKVELSYKRIPSVAKCYDGTLVNCTVYADPEGKIDHSNDKPPTERYLDIMIEGCEHFGVKPEYIQWLRDHEKQPRRNPEDFQSWEVPAGSPIWTYKQIQELTGKEGQPYYQILNNKVLEFVGEKTNNPIFDYIKPYAGTHHELLLGKVQYDPKYGCPEKIEDWTAEARASREDAQFEALKDRDWYKCVGRCALFDYEMTG